MRLPGTTAAGGEDGGGAGPVAVGLPLAGCIDLPGGDDVPVAVAGGFNADAGHGEDVARGLDEREGLEQAGDFELEVLVEQGGEEEERAGELAADLAGDGDGQGSVGGEAQFLPPGGEVGLDAVIAALHADGEEAFGSAVFDLHAELLEGSDEVDVGALAEGVVVVGDPLDFRDEGADGEEHAEDGAGVARIEGLAGGAKTRGAPETDDLQPVDLLAVGDDEIEGLAGGVEGGDVGSHGPAAADQGDGVVLDGGAVDEAASRTETAGQDVPGGEVLGGRRVNYPPERGIGGEDVGNHGGFGNSWGCAREKSNAQAGGVVNEVCLSV
jgi:hypothetical protein